MADLTKYWTERVTILSSQRKEAQIYLRENGLKRNVDFYIAKDCFKDGTDVVRFRDMNHVVLFKFWLDF